MAPRRLHLRKKCAYVAVGIYVVLVLYAVTNGNSRCRVDVPLMFSDPVFTDRAENHKCRVDLNNLDVVKVDIFENVNITDVELANKKVNLGGSWKPSKCQAWQRIAVIVPYRDRWTHLKLLLKRLHPLLQKQKASYQIFVIEQSGEAQFNRGRLMNIGVKEAMKVDKFDCFIFHDVDLLPESDKNIYFCDNHIRQLSSAIDEMRYHVMYYNYAGGVVAINRENIFRVNGYSNDYWGWGSEDDDLSARTMATGLLLTRPPEHIGRFKMIRHQKQWRAEHNYDLFLTWRSRWQEDGLSSLDSSKYRMVIMKQKKLYTMLSVDVGKPPQKPPLDGSAPKESLLWFLKFFFP